MSRPIKPYEQVKAMLGKAAPAWEKLTGYIRFYYVMDEVWDEGKPTHKHHSNLYFRRGGKTLVNLCLRDGHFIVSIVLGKDERAIFEEQRESFGEAVCKEYDDAEVYHDGKWLGFYVHDDSQIDDIIRLLHVKRKPNRKALPGDLAQCGCLDLGLSHEDVTSYVITQ